MVQLSRAVRPIAMFVDESDAALIQAFADVGVSASVVEEKARSGQFSISLRFNAFARLRDALDRTKSPREDRKVVDRAEHSW
jgi:two-component system, response regulator / RNA-binding antiterminator